MSNPMKAAAAAVLLTLATAAHADSLTADFTNLYGVEGPSGGTVTFTLNGDGTIAASLSSSVGHIICFGWDSPSPYGTFETDFSPAILRVAGWEDKFGSHSSGFQGYGDTAVETWTIGHPGDFTSVWQTLGGVYSPYDFFLMADDYQQRFANATPSAVPEPATSALLLAGLGVVGLRARHRRA